MSDQLHRALRLLSLLESRATWGGPELAERLGVTERTVRRDVDRLRQLGYPVDADRGTFGGYRLGVGGSLPPLLLDEDEAVALVASLRMVALQGLDSVGEAALRALVKLDRMLPASVQKIVSTLDEATTALPGSRPDVDWRVLLHVSQALSDQQTVRFTYRRPGAADTEREVEPVRLVTQGQNWYLQAFDRMRDDWRVFRLDRMHGVQVQHDRFEPRTPPPLRPGADLAARWACVALVEFGVPGEDAERVARRIPAPHRDEPRPGSHPDVTAVRVGAPSWDELAWHLVGVARTLGCDLQVGESDELRDAFALLGAQVGRIATRMPTASAMAPKP